MNLIELLSYRETCLIHGTKLNAYYVSNNLTKVDLNNIKIVESLDNDLYIHMVCDLCVKSVLNLNSLFGFTTLMDIAIVHYYYTFWYSSITKEGYLNIEKIKYIYDNKFYHIDANLANGQAFCKMGSFKDGDTIDDILGSFMNLELPKLDMKQINNTPQLVSKIKLWALFS